MSSNASRDYYYSSSSSAASRSMSSRQTLPPLRSVLGAQLDLPVRSSSGTNSYDLREMSRALPRQSPPEHRSSSRRGYDLYDDRDDPYLYRDQRSYAFSSTPSTTTNGHRSTPSYTSGYQYPGRPASPTYKDIGYASQAKQDRGHSNKKYACTWPGCEKRFERQNALDTHMNIHTDEKPYACPVSRCGKVFNVRSNMRRHLLTHKDYHEDENDYRHGH